MNATRIITIPAAVGSVAGVYHVSVSAKVFACLATTAEFELRIGAGGLQNITAGTVLGDASSPVFRSLTFYNSTANAIDATCSVSDNSVNPALLNTVGTITVAAVKDASTYTKGFAAGVVGAGATVTFNGLDSGKQRKQIVIQNNDAAANLLIEDNSANKGFTLKSDRAVTLVTNGIVKLHNDTGASIYCDVLETFYS